MSLWQNVSRRASLAWRSITTSSLLSPQQWLIDFFSGGGAVASGVQVNARTAMGVSAIYACVKVIAEDLGSIPFTFFERDGEARKEATTHGLHELLGHQPNPEMDAGQFVEMMTGHVLLRGNAYAEVVRDQFGKVLALWPLHPDYVTPRRIDHELCYEVNLPSGQRTKDGESFRVLDRSRIFHLKGLSADGVTGLSPLELHAESIGLSIALERHGAALFGNGATPGGVLQADKPLSDKTYERLKKAFEGRHQGLSNAHRVAILENGVKWQQVGLQSDHAQFIESRRLQIEEACRIYRMAQIMVSAQEKSTAWGSGIEQMQVGHVNFTLRPWAVRWERAVRSQLLLPSEKKRFFSRFRLQALMRGDGAARSAYYEKMMGLGAMSSNDIRVLEDENPREGGNVYYRLQALVPADSPGPIGQAQATKPARAVAFTRLLEEAFARALRRAAARVPAAAKKPLAEFQRWSQGYVVEESLALSDGLATVARAMVELLSGDSPSDVDGAAITAWSERAARRQLADVMDEVREIVVGSPLDRAARIEEAAKAWPAFAKESAERELERVVDLISAQGAKEKAA